MPQAAWWQTGIIYQIYPRSFMDRNGDGVGDLQGIIAQLDHLVWLGVNAIWLSPIFPSPMADFGYDVSDYTAIHPLFGTLADFDALLEAAHARGLKLILDLVPNHTSDQHPWFQQARASRDNPKRDWYIWRDAQPDGSPPNNWAAYFGGSMWTWDAATKQYYLHSFLPEQPDLNWRNPEVKAAIFDAVRFWLDRGVDGFRVDVIDRMLKDEQFRDNPVNPDFVPGRDNLAAGGAQQRVYSENQPGIHALIAELRAVFDAYDDRVLIGEIAYSTDPTVITTHYGGSAAPEQHLPINFALLLLPWEVEALRAFIAAYEAALPAGGWPNYVLSNHDQPRIASKLGDAEARIAAMLLLTLRGTPFVYYGDEIGMHNVPIPQDQVQDPQGINMPGTSRDPERTPMQWHDGPNAGFSTATPWLPIADDYLTVNVEAERADPHSILNLYRRLIAYRRDTPALTLGAYQALDSGELADTVLVYERQHENQRVVVALNFAADPKTISLPAGQGRIGVSTHMERSGETVALDRLVLRPHEGLIVEVV
ncbi:MAG: DUF3459 domain-containing protein [Chloroflexi bacterium]|nr:DUF3459 domain-containing protein [Chloroflexota bacterium]